ncbi:IS5 family transposase [Paraburkholderia sp. WC7.3g]
MAESGRAALTELIGRTKRILAQKPKDRNKLYALHAPEVECLAKGKARTPYEFGVKVVDHDDPQGRTGRSHALDAGQSV